MSGTPPFQVTYTMQREDELPQEISKTSNALKDEVNIQPSRSGRYIFNFVRMGDAHYQRVELQGPKIEQSIPEAAMALFTSGKIIPGSNKRLVDSCDTGVVGVDVELKVN
jgi:nucleoporin POM152